MIKNNDNLLIDDIVKQYGFYVGSNIFHTRREAELFFMDDLIDKLYWIKGIKVWRVEPSVTYTKDFETNSILWNVSARITALEVVSLKDIEANNLKIVDIDYAKEMISEK